MGTGVIASVRAALDSFTYRNAFWRLRPAPAAPSSYMLVTVFMLPLFFKLGAEKARVAMTPCFILPFLLIVWGFSWLGDGAAAFVESLPWPMIATVGGLILVLLCAASFFVSVKFYESKEY
ncbi:MAG: ABC-2 transporter permease [Ruthenibacterium lactatiformans]